MTDTKVTDYLLELSEALADVPRDTRREILAGVREELEGLKPAEAAERIRALGDPQFIAAGAREDVVAPPEPQWRSVVAALLVMLGGVLVPFAGWIAGIAIMWTSRAWSPRVKLVATLLPLIAALQVAVVGGIFARINEQQSDLRDIGFHGPSLNEFESANPLLPIGFDLLYSGTILSIGVSVIVGIWLLVIANKPQLGSSAATWGVIPVVAGSVLLPPAGWLLGLVVLWTSRATVLTKAVMTAIGPVALILALAVTGAFTEDTVLLVTAAIAVPFLASLVAAILLLRPTTSKVNS
ncbi:hypothetical protein EYE40_07235 [Glaciihabitans arcticus]|uniref:Uncharacterized protein n=1 Tax=Glaciihabitans arcticus TaxID=2668039 RepID=A0A4Q9GVI2_9MICO|nr:hypothetical protein [Glaciihabitans arcticus]TBN57207.1 hypothetical protein EYE40_07235 [Glaciihabitans arcticus]